MSLFHKKDSYLGVDIGAHGIKIIELKKTKNRPQLWTYGMLSKPLDIHPSTKKAQHEEVPLIIEETTAKKQGKKEMVSLLDPDDTKKITEYGDLLKEVMKKAKISSRRATASLPVSQVFHAIITLPAVEQKDLDHHVRAKVKKMISQPIEDMQIVHQLIPDPNKDKKKIKFLRVLVTAAPKKLVSFYSAIFQHAGLQLEELETEAFALERSLVGHDTATVMVIDIGAERTNFFIIDQGLPITHRSIYLGGNIFDIKLQEMLGVSAEQVGQVKKDISRMSADQLSPELFQSFTEPLIKEIGYSIDVFTRQIGNEQKRLEKIILTGGASLFPPVLASIQEKFPVNVFIGDPWARIVYQQGLKEILDAIGPRMAVSIGLAMRNIV
jgi:type IV pilus assembly protein PilM